MKKRITSLLLVFCLLFTLFPATAMAVETEDGAQAGLCPHHTQHDETCGYAEAVEGVPCTHVCSVDTGCVTIDCVHEHDDSCGWTEDDPDACDHTCTSASGCVSLYCIHEHDGDCGYEPGSAAVPCGFVCQECAAEGDLTYSDTGLTLSVMTPYLDEGDIAAVTLTRDGDVSRAAAFTVVVYDNSANYGADYRILYNGTAVQKIAGAASVYDTFRNNGELTDGVAFDLAMGLAASEIQQSGEEEETVDVSAADVLSQLDELDAKAVEFPVTFAAGERTASLTIEVFDDEEPEYEETFLMAVLDADGDLVETAQQAFAIEDNDAPAPGVSVSFDCEAEMELTDENDQVELTFRRTGALATTTLVVLYVDGQAYGKVDFAPWQEIQKVDGVLAGVYTLTDMDGQPIAGQVEVFDNRTAQLSVADGADPVLDAVPEEYAVIRTPRTDSPGTSWLPDWALGKGEDEAYSIVMGTKNNNLFKEGSSKKSDLNFFVDGNNYHELTTSGTGSHMRTGWQNMDKKTAIDLTGVESVESTMYITGLDNNAEISMGIQDQPWTTLKLSDGNGDDEKAYTITARVFDGKTNSDGSKTDYRQASKLVYFQNKDPDNSSGGTNLFVPNALKLNLRKYRFIIEDDYTKMGGYNDHMVYGSDTNRQVRVPTVSMPEQFMTINSRLYGTNKSVFISYGTSGDKYPARLVGYRLKDASGSFSEQINLYPSTSDSNPGVGIGRITLDRDFLKKYEMQYATYMDKNNSGAKYWTFTVIPIYEKIECSGINILESVKGSITYTVLDGGSNTSKIPCLGDQILVSQTGDVQHDLKLSGVWYQAMDKNGVGIRDQQISENRPDAGKNEFTVDIDYPYYKIEGAFSTEANRLLVYYEDADNPHGTLQTSVNTKNEAVSADQYMVNDFVPLMAKPDDGYVTRWRVESLSTYYYGNIYYYQLDGHPDHNVVYVDFVLESEVNPTTSTLTGTLSQSYVQLRAGGYSSTVKLANTPITINAGATYSVTTDANGQFSIPDFKGVAGATYSMVVVYDNSTSYTTFTYTPFSNLNVEMTQFPAGVAYPVSAAAYVTGESQNTTTLTLNTSSAVVVSTNVYVPAKNNTVTGVKFYFANPTVVSSGMESPETVAYAATRQGTNGSYEVWGLTITDTSSIISGQQLYVEVLFDRTTYTTDASGSTTKTTMSMSTGLTDTGYDVATNLQADEYNVIYDVPSTPSMQSVSDIIHDFVPIDEIPVLGNLDFSVTSKTGGFFSQRSDSNGNAILICGSSYLANFGTGTVAQKLEDKQKTKDALIREENKAGAANADVTTVSNSTSKFASVSAPSKFLFNPAFLFKFTFSPKADGKSIYISRYEMALGVDAFYIRNIPFSIYGVPFYVCLNIVGEAYFDLQATFDEETNLQAGDWDSEMLSKVNLQSLDTFLAAPALSFTAKGGIGYNAFLSLYLSSSVTCPFIFALTPDIENGGVSVKAAAKFAYTIGAGADVVLFSGQINASTPTAEVGSKDLFDDLTTITQKANSKTAVASTAGEALEAADLETMLDNITFAPMLRTAVRQAVAGNGVIASGAFKNTGVHLLKLSDSNVLAFYLQDNQKDGTLNYLTVAYAESTDGGETWGETKYVSDNTQQPNTSLQFDVNLFRLDDRILVTWSEANFDEVLDNLENVDINALTPAQIARCMNAMDLKGRFFTKNGTPMGEAFTIAENSTVACGALDAVQNGDMVYVYYQRNTFPWDESTETVTLSDLLSTDRTIAMARASVDDPSSWTSTKVRATKEGTEQEYRITEVEPFVHDGVMGEILELDRDGKLAEWDENTETWTISNEDRQLYLRTYDFDEKTGEPIPSALMAITDANDCARNPQVVSNDEYLHLFWNQNGKVVYLTDFVATDTDTEAIQDTAYVVKKADGTITTHDPRGDDGVYGASYIAGDDDSFHIGTTFSASMDDDGHVLLSWVSTAPENTDDTDEAAMPADKIYGVVLETVKDDNGTDYLSSRGTAVALTDSYETIGALDSVFLVTHPDNGSNFLLAFSTLDNMAEQANSAAVRAVKSVYAPDLEITEVNAPSYPMPGSEMTVSVTVANRGLGEATNVAVNATGVGTCNGTSIASILPGCSATVELTVHIPEGFHESTDMNITAGDASETVDVLYGPYFVIKSDPVTSNVAGTCAYRTETEVYNAGNAPGVPALDYQVSLFAKSERAKEYPTCTAAETVAPGETIHMISVLEDTPVTSNDVTGTLTTTVHVDGDLSEGQYNQCQLPRLATVLTKEIVGDVTPSDPGNSGSSGDSSSGSSASNKHSVTVGTTANGTVTVSPRSAEKGDTVTITTRPDAGYETGTVTVTDRNGNTVKVSRNSNGTYSFAMPSAAVTVAVTFVRSAATGFTDVPESAYFHDPVLWAAEKGITGGVTATTFAPYASCTRAQIVTFLWRAAGCPAPQSVNRFTDVPDTAYYAQAVAWAVENGITTGVTDTTFQPDAPCTRAQAVAFLFRYAASQGMDAVSLQELVSSYSDADQVPGYAASAFNWALANGIVQGNDGALMPNSTCTRAQIVTFLYRFLED